MADHTIGPAAGLRESLEAGRCIVAPGVFDGLSARVADGLGFGALYLTGFGVSASLLGRPDAGYLTATHFYDRVRTLCAVIRTPLIADADTGFGGPLNVEDAVRAYEAGGAAAIQIEDQEFPKRCGHTRNRRVIDLEAAVEKVRMAVRSRDSGDFLVVARTDARTSLGLDEALRRGDAFLEAGADILFIESPESEAELERIGRSFSGAWLLANMVDGGSTPILDAGTLAGLGFHVAIHPLVGLASAAEAYRQRYTDLLSAPHSDVPATAFDELARLVGFEDVWALDDLEP
jgi:2-methylisocitrate lyase-like PEP mutase family enzyme